MPKKSPSFAGNPLLVGIGNAIRVARKAQGLSQEALAEKADIDRSYIGGIERGEHNLAVINLQKISKALDIKLSSLLQGTDL